jgi:hypothetical protein
MSTNLWHILNLLFCQPLSTERQFPQKCYYVESLIQHANISPVFSSEIWNAAESKLVLLTKVLLKFFRPTELHKINLHLSVYPKIYPVCNILSMTNAPSNHTNFQWSDFPYRQEHFSIRCWNLSPFSNLCAKYLSLLLYF